MKCQQKNNGLIIVITLLLYLINQQIKTTIPFPSIRMLMCCYFNDVIGSMTFLAYCNIILGLRNINLIKLWQIELLMFACGFYWEIITPLYRLSTVTDYGDFLAYLFGGILYWGILQIQKYL